MLLGRLDGRCLEELDDGHVLKQQHQHGTDETAHQAQQEHVYQIHVVCCLARSHVSPSGPRSRTPNVTHTHFSPINYDWQEIEFAGVCVRKKENVDDVRLWNVRVVLRGVMMCNLLPLFSDFSISVDNTYHIFTVSLDATTTRITQGEIDAAHIRVCCCAALCGKREELGEFCTRDRFH